MKVLISAYACSPYRGSEPGVGWGFISALSRLHDVFVITEKHEFEEVIQDYLQKDEILKRNIEFFYVPRIRHKITEKIWPPSYYWTYRKWHWDAYLLAKRLHEEIGFDIVHQLTMAGFREPGYLWKLDVPFVWGPIGGMGLFPWRFLPSAGFYGAIYYLGYNVMNMMHMKFLKRPKEAAKSADRGLITATSGNRDGAYKYWGVESTIISEVGWLRHGARGAFTQRKAGEPLRIIWSGLHLPGKALNLALHALSLLSGSVDFELHVLGKGPMTAKWKNLAENLGVLDRCHFHGWVCREKAFGIMEKGHLMLITSLKDLTSTVTVEALSLGLPVICLDHCGFRDAIDETCGIKIPVTDPGQVVRDLSEAIQRIAEDEQCRLGLSRGAFDKARNFSWEKKAEMVDDIYMQVCSEHRKRKSSTCMEKR